MYERGAEEYSKSPTGSIHSLARCFCPFRRHGDTLTVAELYISKVPADVVKLFPEEWRGRPKSQSEA